VTYKVRLTGEAHEDLGRLYDLLLSRDLGAAERALVAIERALNLLAFSPFSCRKALL
jgi:plasmid stabilization system protein ParE